MIQIIKKYEGYISNMEWHINTNNPTGEVLQDLTERLEIYKECLSDLQQFTTPPIQGQEAIIERIKELIKPWQQMEKNIDDYACAKNDRQRERAMTNGIKIREAMEKNLKGVISILYSTNQLPPLPEVKQEQPETKS